jgi:hypothetical protein
VDGNGAPIMRQDRPGFVFLKKLIARERALMLWTQGPDGDADVIYLNDGPLYHVRNDMETLVKMELDDLAQKLGDGGERLGRYLLPRVHRRWVQRFEFLGNHILPRMNEAQLEWLDGYLRGRLRELRDDMQRFESRAARKTKESAALAGEIRALIESSLELTFRAIFRPGLIEGMEAMPGDDLPGVDVQPIRIVASKK